MLSAECNQGVQDWTEGLSAMSYVCPPIVSVTLSVTDSEGGRVGKHFVVCRQYAIPTTIAVGAGGGSSRAQL